MDEEVTPAQVELQGTVITTSAGNVLSPQQTAVNAAALGWALAELLGRCFALKEAQPAELNWSGDKLMRLQEIYTPREKIRALVFLIGILAFVVMLGILLFVIISNPTIITKDVAAVIALLTTLGITHTLGSTVGNILEKAVSEVTGTFRGTVIDNIRHTTQQEAVNKATFISPASANQNVVQNTQARG